MQIKYLTVLVQDRANLQWEVMIEDIRLDSRREQDFWEQMARRTEKREAVYSPAHWQSWTHIAELPRRWRQAFAEQKQGGPSPLTGRNTDGPSDARG